MNVLVLGKDKNLFHGDDVAYGDVRRRHCLYAKELVQQTGSNSSIRIICYTPIGNAYRETAPADGLTLFPTRSIHRITFALGLLRLLPRVLRGWRPDLVTTQTPWGEAILGYLVARLTSAAFMPQLHFDLFSDRWLKESPLNHLHLIVARYLLRRADVIRVVSSRLKKQLAHDLAGAAKPICVVPVAMASRTVPSVSREQAQRETLPSEFVGKPVVLYVGRFSYEKNLALWVEVAQRVGAANGDTRFVLAGDGQLHDEISNMIQATDIRDRFLLLGEVAYSKLAQLYAAANLLLLTSNHEGLGRVVCEAFFSGLPVVSTRCGGPEEIISDGQNGYLIPIGDRAGLVNRVIDLLHDPQKAATFGRRGQTHMQETLSEELLISTMIDCWVKGASKNSRARL